MEKINEFGGLFICGGCNAKIGPGNLSKLLNGLPQTNDDRLLVGFDSTDDAGVIKLSDDVALIQTLDFFPTMVSDPYLFGKIAATNALSDVYAMGGKVLSAMNIVCFPEEMDINILGEILRGGSEVIQEAKALLVGGHSIHDSTPKYGLSVTGTIHPDNILTNNNCQVGDILILTKAIGVGIITTAYSVGETTDENFAEAISSMTTLNKYASEVIVKHKVSSCTDVTGFGLLGHLSEMLGENQTAYLTSRDIPVISGAYECAQELLVTAGGQRNRNFLNDKVLFKCDDFAIEELMFDPQTSGGLLISVPAEYAKKLVDELQQVDQLASVIGKVVELDTHKIIIE
ncbi:selenide, water dikinase SelD [Vagococcus coleopterorum]|uniref:selenide, water dikinase SelD n=1 Tax=Vagococcus coleopterorum TaxID=2714946 RepID=UPI001EEBBE09|nr:selenide, water dikinase SelD [Vagococcus coleopterorum]